MQACENGVFQCKECVTDENTVKSLYKHSVSVLTPQRKIKKLSGFCAVRDCREPSD